MNDDLGSERGALCASDHCAFFFDSVSLLLQATYDAYRLSTSQLGPELVACFVNNSTFWPGGLTREPFHPCPQFIFLLLTCGFSNTDRILQFRVSRQSLIDVARVVSCPLWRILGLQAQNGSCEPKSLALGEFPINPRAVLTHIPTPIGSSHRAPPRPV